MNDRSRRAALLALLVFVPAIAVAQQSVAPSDAPAERVHLHRPGTDVEADTLVGNGTRETFTLTGNVVLHSDPKVDTAFAATQSDEPLTLTTDKLEVDRKALTYVATGHVHFTQGARSGVAETASLDERTHDIELIGHARVSDGVQRLESDRMHYNTLDRHFHGSGNVEIVAPIPTAAPGAAKPTTTPKPKKLRLPF